MNSDGWGKEHSPFHRGEQDMQTRYGLREQAEAMGRQMFRPYMPEQHRTFFEQLPFFIVGSVDKEGWPWASILFGEPGFVSTPDARSVEITRKAIIGDPLEENLKVGSLLGGLGIELPTRRRNRVNMTVTEVTDDSITAAVDQSFGNCPQYIQTRHIAASKEDADMTPPKLHHLTAINERAVNIITAVDTFFVASVAQPDEKRDIGGVDVSHRGGRPGFVKVDGDTLTVPDYMGNFLFNTLGNFLVNPKAGLLFIDFETGDLLYLIGETELIWEDDPEMQAFTGAERGWRFHMKKGVLLEKASPISWSFDAYSPTSLATGNWEEASAALAAEEKRQAWRPYRVKKIEDESASIRSFYLEPSDGAGLLPFEPGQFLTLRINGEDGKKISRTYSLSSAPSTPVYRISVKREKGGGDVTPGLVSNHLHDRLSVGDTIEAKAPAGRFTYDALDKRPAVLIGAGVGITPMIAMAQQAAYEGVRARYIRPTTIFQIARSTDDRAFAVEFSRLQQATGGVIRYISLITQPTEGQQEGRDFHIAGRLNPALLSRVTQLDGVDFYLCGPSSFMQATYDMLIEMGVEDSAIFAESFGPSTLKRWKMDNGVSAHVGEAAESATVLFSDSDAERVWTREDGSLLDFAEKNGLTPAFGCRNGVCGSCAVKKLSGEVIYDNEPTGLMNKNDVLLCCAHPAKDTERLVLDI